MTRLSSPTHPILGTVSDAEAAIRMGVSESAARNKRRRLKIASWHAPGRPAWTEALTDDVLLRWLGEHPESTVVNAVQSLAPRFSDQRIAAALLDLFRRGLASRTPVWRRGFVYRAAGDGSFAVVA